MFLWCGLKYIIDALVLYSELIALGHKLGRPAAPLNQAGSIQAGRRLVILKHLGRQDLLGNDVKFDLVWSLLMTHLTYTV